MRKITSILCSIAFAISGIMLAVTASDPSSNLSYKTMSAATLPLEWKSQLQMPQDLLLDLAKKSVSNTPEVTTGSVDSDYVDSLQKRIASLEKTKQVTKVKVKKVPVPSNVMEINVTASHRTDTVQVPVYYLATQVGNKEGPTGECISVYEVHKVDEICPEIPNSSVEPVNELDNDVGE